VNRTYVAFTEEEDTLQRRYRLKRLKTAKGELAKAPETITAAAVAGLEGRLLGALGGFEQTVAASGRQVADEYREMRKISEKQIRGVRFWSRFSYGAVFASAAALWLAVCLASYVWLDRRHGQEYQSRLAEVEANYTANNASLKKLAEAGGNSSWMSAAAGTTISCPASTWCPSPAQPASTPASLATVWLSSVVRNDSACQAPGQTGRRLKVAQTTRGLVRVFFGGGRIEVASPPCS